MAPKRAAGGKFMKGNKSGTPKKSAGPKKAPPAFLTKRLKGKRGSSY